MVLTLAQIKLFSIPIIDCILILSVDSLYVVKDWKKSFLLCPRVSNTPISRKTATLMGYKVTGPEHDGKLAL